MASMTPEYVVSRISEEFPELHMDSETGCYYIPCGSRGRKIELIVAQGYPSDFCLRGIGALFRADEDRTSKFDYGGSIPLEHLDSGDLDIFIDELHRVVPLMSRENDRLVH